MNDAFDAKAPGSIKSIQRGVSTITGGSVAVSISRVDPNKTVLALLGFTTNTAVDSTGNPYIFLQDAQTLKIMRAATSVTESISWQLVEYN